MQFLYPIFLIAGLSVLIPILIHLFNLRRYKTVLFPHTRFLKSLQLHSRKQSQLRYKVLLLTRILFLLFLVVAFTQPFWSHQKGASSQQRLIAIYIDNSQSMSLQSGQRSLLDLAKENALQLIQQGGQGFFVLTNDHSSSFRPLNYQQAKKEIEEIQISERPKTNVQLLNEVQQLMQNESIKEIDLCYFSDFQQSSFLEAAKATLFKQIHFRGLQLVQHKAQNIYIDTAFFESPVLQTGQSNKLIVRSKYCGVAPNQSTVLQLSVNGQLKSAAAPVFGSEKEHWDTLAFQINDNQWQKIQLSINDAQVHFDDTFTIAAKRAPELSVLLLNEGRSNVYLQAALRSYNGFKVEERSMNQMPEKSDGYNLIILQGVRAINSTTAVRLQKALANGQNVCLFLGQDVRQDELNGGLKQISDIQIIGLDTAAQSVATIQRESRLIKDMFEQIPENVQLPYAQNHYQIKAGLSANQQSVLSFRNGDPFFAIYQQEEGLLYICATSLSPQNGNFQSSYFFVPFLYQMASAAQSTSIYALTAGQKAPIYVPQRASGLTQMRLLADGLDAIPPQHAKGMGTEVFVGAIAQQSGFYTIVDGTADSMLIAVNGSRVESDLSVWTQGDLKKRWSGNDIQWQVLDTTDTPLVLQDTGAWPLWKLCSILALLMLGIETYLLSKNLRKQKAITIQ